MKGGRNIIQTKLSILDDEIGPGLCSYLLQHASRITPVLYSSWKELLRDPAGIALVGTGFWSDEEAKKVAGKGVEILRLDEAYLTPYQPADQLMKEVYQLLMERQIFIPHVLHTYYKKEVIAVCSSHGHDLQTAFAFIYAALRSEKKRTLYLDFSYYNGFFQPSEGDLGDFLYEMDKHKGQAAIVLPSFTRSFASLDYLLPVRTQMDLEDLTGEDFTRLITRLLQESEYELLVINLPVRPSFLRAVYGCCSHMYSLQREGNMYDQTQSRLVEDLRLESETELTNLQIVPMPKLGGNFCLDESMYKELLFGEMADFIRTTILKEESCRTI